MGIESYPPPAGTYEVIGGALGCVPVSSWYYASAGLLTTVTPPSNGKAHFTPFHLSVPSTLYRIGTGITAAGQTGALLRLGLYGDTNGAPGSLVVDAGTVAADAIANVEITLGTPLALAAGRYWLCSATQNSATTRPTVRGVNNFNSEATGAESLALGVANTNPGVQSGDGIVTGALPSTAPAVLGGSQLMRVVVRFGS